MKKSASSLLFSMIGNAIAGIKDLDVTGHYPQTIIVQRDEDHQGPTFTAVVTIQLGIDDPIEKNEQTSLKNSH